MSATLLRSATTYARPSIATSTPSSSATNRPSRRAVIAGRILTGIVALLLTLDAGIKLVRARAAVEGSAQLGFTADQVNARVAQLSPQDLHQLANNLDQLNAAGLTRQEWIWVGIGAAAAIILIIALG